MSTATATPDSKATPGKPADKRRGFWKGLFGSRQSPAKIKVQAVPTPAPTPAPAIVEPEAGPSQVVELVHALRNHIDQQSDRSERLLDKMADLPEALRSLPQASATSERLLETMQKHLDQQQGHATRLIQVIEDMSTASKHRDKTIDVLQRQIVTTQSKDAQLMEGFQSLTRTMSKMGDIQAKSAGTLHQVAETASRAEARMHHAVAAGRRHTLTWMLSVGAMALVLLAMTAFVTIATMRIAAWDPAPAAAPMAPAVEAGLPMLPVFPPAADDGQAATSIEGRRASASDGAEAAASIDDGPAPAAVGVEAAATNEDGPAPAADDGIEAAATNEDGPAPVADGVEAAATDDDAPRPSVDGLESATTDIDVLALAPFVPGLARLVAAAPELMRLPSFDELVDLWPKMVTTPIRATLDAEPATEHLVAVPTP